MTNDAVLDGYARRKEVDRPHEVYYFRRFPLRPDERERAGQVFKLIADYGLAEGVHTAMRRATEAAFE